MSGNPYTSPSICEGDIVEWDGRLASRINRTGVVEAILESENVYGSEYEGYVLVRASDAKYLVNPSITDVKVRN